MAFPGTYNFNYYRGDTFQFIVRPKDGSGNPFSLTNFTAAMTIADKIGPNPTQSFVADVVKDNVGGLVCTILPTVGRDLTPGTNWQYDVEIKNSNEIFTLLKGTITVTDDITGADGDIADDDIGES
jgi:hypothetical protein